MALVTVQRSPTPSTVEEEDVLEDDVLSESLHSASDYIRSPRSRCLSESYFVVRGAAIILPKQGVNQNMEDPTASTSAAGGEIQQHLQAMLPLLRPQDTVKMAVRLETLVGTSHTRYLVIVSTTGRQDNTESIILGIDYVSSEKTTIGLYLPIWASTNITLDGDGGIRVESADSLHIFKPVSVQAMWSAFQSLQQESKVAREETYFPRGLTHTWVHHYQTGVNSIEAFKTEWHYTYPEDNDLKAESIERFREKPPQRRDAENNIRNSLKLIMHSVDLDNVTSKDIRLKLEEQLEQNLAEYKEFIDTEMLVILGQMDKPSQIFDFLYLGTEWNASNYDELKSKNIGYILNVTKEVDNFFPGHFSYMKIRVSDEETTELMKFWDQTYNFIAEAKANQQAVLVHCKKGISRSSSTVIAYAMKQFMWDLEQSVEFVKSCRNCITPNRGFIEQLRTYQGILGASKNRKSMLWNPPPTNKQEPHETSGVTSNSAVYSSPNNPSLNPPGLLVASENILKGTSTPLTKETIDETSRRLAPDSESNSIKEVNSSLDRVNARPPVVRQLQSVEKKISLKGEEQVTLAHVQKLVLHPRRRKGKSSACDSSSGNSSDCSSGLNSSGDECDILWTRNRSHSESGGSTGDSAVVDIERSISPQHKRNMGNRTKTADHLTNPGQVLKFKEKYEQGHQHIQTTPEKTVHKRRPKFMDRFRKPAKTATVLENNNVHNKSNSNKQNLHADNQHKPILTLKVAEPGKVREHLQLLEKKQSKGNIGKGIQQKVLDFAAEESSHVRSLAARFEGGDRPQIGSGRNKSRLKRPTWRPRSLSRIMLGHSNSLDEPFGRPKSSSYS